MKLIDSLRTRSDFEKHLTIKNQRNKKSNKKSSRQLLISSVLFTIFHVICAMQIMSGTQPDTFINALLSTKIRQSVDIS